LFIKTEIEMAKFTFGGVIGGVIASGIWGAVYVETPMIALTVVGLIITVIVALNYWE